MTLTIRFASPDTTPSRYSSGGWTRSDVVTRDDYWTVRGPEWALVSIVRAALEANDLNDYGIR